MESLICKRCSENVERDQLEKRKEGRNLERMREAKYSVLKSIFIK